MQPTRRKPRADSSRDRRDADREEVSERSDEELDAEALLGESEHSVRSSGQRDLMDEEDIDDRYPSTSAEDGLPISPDDLGEKYLENATEAATIKREPPRRDRS